MQINSNDSVCIILIPVAAGGRCWLVACLRCDLVIGLKFSLPVTGDSVSYLPFACQHRFRICQIIFTFPSLHLDLDGEGEDRVGDPHEGRQGRQRER